MDVYISQTGVNKLTIRRGKKLPSPDENVVGNALPQLKSNGRSSANVPNNIGSTYHVFNNVHSWTRDPSPTGESSSSSSVGGLSIGGTLLKCSIAEMSPSSLVLPSPKDSGVDVNSPCHRGDEEGVMSLGGVAHVVDCDVGAASNGADVGSDRCRRAFVTALTDPGQRGSGLRNSSNESSQAIVKESLSKSTKLDPSRQSSFDVLQADHQLSAPQRTQSPLVIKRHRDTSRPVFNANSDEVKSKSVAGSTDASSRDIYSFGGTDAISPIAKVTKARRVQRPTHLTNLPHFNDEVPADSEPTPARMGFRFFSGDRRRSNVADNAAVRLLREFTGVNNGEKKGVDKKMISSDKRINVTPAIAPLTTTVDSKESSRKYTLVPVEKPDANKLIIKFSTTGQRAIGTAASSQGTPVQASLTSKAEPALLTVKKGRSTKLAAKGSLLAVSNKNSLKGKSKGLASLRSLDRLASTATDKSPVMYPGIKKLADGGSALVTAVRDPLLEATYRPRPSRGTILNLNTTSTVKDPVVLGSTSLSTVAHQSHPVVDLPSATAAAASQKNDGGNNLIKPNTERVETQTIGSKSKQSFSAVIERPAAEKISSEISGYCAIKCKVDDTRKTSFIISLKTTSAKLAEDTSGANVIAQTGVEKTNSDIKNIADVNDKIEIPKNIAVCPSSIEQELSVVSVVPEVTTPSETKREAHVDSAVRKVDELKVKVDELKVPPLTINKISLSIKRGSAGSWYVPESSKERRRERKLKKREKGLSGHRDDRPDSSGVLHNAVTMEQHNPPSFSLSPGPLSFDFARYPMSLECKGDSEKLANTEVVASFTPNANLKPELPNSSTLALREKVTSENYHSAALPVQLDTVLESPCLLGSGIDSRKNDNVGEKRQNEMQSYISKKVCVRPEERAWSNPDVCVKSNLHDGINAQSTSIKLTTHKKSKKHGKKNEDDVSVLLSGENNLAESVTTKSTSHEITEMVVVPEKKTKVKLTRPWEDVIPNATTVKLTTSTSVLSQFKEVSLESRISLNNEHKSALSAFSGEEERFRFLYSNSNDNQTHLTRPFAMANYNFSNECKKSTDTFSSVTPAKKIHDHDDVDSADLIGESINLSPVVIQIEKSTEKVETSKTSPDDFAMAVNGKRKGSNVSNLNGVIAKKYKTAAEDAILCSLNDTISPVVMCSSANKVNYGNAHKLNGIVERLSNLNECSKSLTQGERKGKADTKVTASFVNTDQLEKEVEQRLKGTDFVDISQVNSAAERSFKSVFIDDQRLIHYDVACRSSDKEQESCPSVSIDDSVSPKENSIENDENKKQTAVEFHSQLTEKVSSVIGDDRPTLAENEVVFAEIDRTICSPSRIETVVDQRIASSENEVLFAPAVCPISSPSRNVSLTSPDCSQVRLESLEASLTATMEKSNRPIKRDKSTVKRKYIKEKVQPCELPLPKNPPAISTSRKSIAVCSSRLVEPSVLEDCITPKISKYSSGITPEAKHSLDVQQNQRNFISGDILNDRVKDESVNHTKRKDMDLNKAPIAFDLRVSTVQSNDRADSSSCFGRAPAEISKTIDNADSYSRNRWKNSPYSFFLNDNSDNDDVEDFSSCNINTPSPSSSPRSLAKDNITFASNKDNCPSSFDSLYDDRISTNFEAPAFKLTGEIYLSKVTTKTKTQKGTRAATKVVTGNTTSQTGELISNRRDSMVSNCFQPDGSLLLSDVCVGSMTSLETLTPPPSACEVALDLSDSCGIPPPPPSAINKDDQFSREYESLPINELRTSSGAVLDVDAVSEFLNVNQYSINASSQDPIECIVNGRDEKNAKKDEELLQNELHELSFSSDLNTVDTAYMDIISSLSLGDATPFSDMSSTSRSEGGKIQRGSMKQSCEPNESPSRSAEKLSMCRPWSDSDKATIVKDIEELEQQSRLFDDANGENRFDTTGNNNNAGSITHCGYDPLDIDSIIRSICSDATNEGGDATVERDGKVLNKECDRVTEHNVGSCDLAALEPMLEPLVLSSFDPSTFCGLDDCSSLTTSEAAVNEETKSASLTACLDVTTKDLISSVDDVKEPETSICVRESKDEHKEVENKPVKCVGYLGAFAKFLQCSGPLACDQQSTSLVDADEIKDEASDAAILGSDNAVRSKQMTSRSMTKKNKNRNLVENNYCASPLSTDLDESRLFTAAGGNNQVTRRNSRIFRRSTLLKQMCRFRQDGGLYEDDGTGTDSDHTSSRSNRSYSAGGTKDKSRQSSKVINCLDQVNEEAMLHPITRHDILHPVTQTTTKEVDDVVKEAVVDVTNAATLIKDSFVSVQLELAELEASVRLLFDVMFSGGIGGMGGFSIIPKIFSASVTDSASSGVEQLLDAICTILAGGDDANENADKNAGSVVEGNRQATHSDGVIVLCNQPQSCLARLKRKIATVLTLVLPDLAIDAEEIYREESVGELLRMVISANTNDSLRAIQSSSFSSVAGSNKASSQFTTPRNSNSAAPPPNVPEQLDAKRKLNDAGDLDSRTRLDIALKGSERNTIPLTRDEGASNNSRKKRVNKTETRKGRSLPSHSLSRALPTDQGSTTGT